VANVTTKLKPNIAKIIESVLYLINAAEKSGVTITQYQIVKALFIADDSHLREFGRPVTFSNYSALKFGPVPSEAYDMLKPSFKWVIYDMEKPWNDTPAPEINQHSFKYSLAGRAPNLKALSVSDQKKLEDAFEYVSKNGFGVIKDYTHEHIAYKNAWRDGVDRKSFPINYEDMIPGCDKDRLYQIFHASKYM
jgi:hypothetical protein